MKSPVQKIGIWSLCLLVSGGCGSMQSAYENYLRDEILNRGEWNMTVDAGVGQKGLEGRVVVSGCVDVEVEAAHDEFVPINQPQQGTTPAGGYQPVSPGVKPAWTPLSEAPSIAPQPTPTVRTPGYQPMQPTAAPTYRPTTVPQTKTTPAPAWQPTPAASPAVRQPAPPAAPQRPTLAPTNTTRPAPATQPAPTRPVPQPAAPTLGRPAAPAPAVAPAMRPGAAQPRNASQPVPTPPPARPASPAQPVAKPAQGVTLPRGGMQPQTSPLQASPAAAPVKGAPAVAPAAPAGAGLRKPGRPRINLPGQPAVLEGSDDTSVPTRFDDLTLAMLAGGAAESALTSANGGRSFRAQNGDSWDEPEAPAASPPAGFTVVHVPARYENRCETWGVAGATVRISVGNVEASATTEKDGRFYISDGSQLARLQAAGDAGVVTASLRGRTAQAALRLGGLNEVAAFRLLDAMTNPRTEEVIAFVQEWKGTDAAVLAVDRFGTQACGEFRADWDEMMATAEMQRILAVQGRYQGAWTEVFAEPCAAEISMLPTLEDMASELGLLGAP